MPITVTLTMAIGDHCEWGFLFPGQIDGHISPGWAGTVISRLMPDGASMHALRHRFASKGYAGTRNRRAVQDALGHAGVATTERYTSVTRAVRIRAEMIGVLARELHDERLARVRGRLLRRALSATVEALCGPRLMSAQQVADDLGINRSRVWHLVDNGRLKRWTAVTAGYG